MLAQKWNKNYVAYEQNMNGNVKPGNKHKEP